MHKDCEITIFCGVVFLIKNIKILYISKGTITLKAYENEMHRNFFMNENAYNYEIEKKRKVQRAI